MNSCTSARLMMERCTSSWCFVWLVFMVVLISVFSCGTVSGLKEEKVYNSAVGDSGMKRDGLRVALESWNQCNEVGEEAPSMGSPRYADCFDVYQNILPHKTRAKACSVCDKLPYMLVHRVTEHDNKLGLEQVLSGGQLPYVDLFAAEKELYLASKCQVEDTPNPWHFWMIMLKSGNMDTFAAKCPENGRKSKPFGPDPGFPCFGKGCMNHPLVYHNYTTLQGPDQTTLRGSFYGTWDLDSNSIKKLDDKSYFSVTWEKEIGSGSWVFHHFLRTSPKYPWLMLYLRSDATKGFSSGYHYETRGMSKIIPESPNFKVKFSLEVIQGGGPESQFYLMDIGSCWKNNGQPCDGDVTTDVTRYSEMILNPQTTAWCSPTNLRVCPPHHTFSNGSLVHRNDTTRFPYAAYHLHCSPGNAEHLEEPYNLCDPYSNPQPQEILQILPHPVWGEYGYPTTQGEGWIGQPKAWELDVGSMSQSLYFYQDPGSKPARRLWMSVDLGAEIYRDANQVAEWKVSHVDILVPQQRGTTSNTSSSARV